MKPAEFLRRLRRLGRDRGTSAAFHPDQGKGSHGTVYFGARRTILKGHGEIGKGLLAKMLKDLDIDRKDF